MNINKLFKLGALFVLTVLLSTFTFAQTFVNNTNGDDANGTGTAVNPYRTIAKAISVTPSGGTISIAADVYNEAAITVGKPLTFVATTFNSLSTVTITNGLEINTANATDVVSLGETGQTFNLGTTAGALKLTKGVLNIASANVVVGSGATITRTAGSINATPTVTNVNVVYNGAADITAGPELAANIGSGSLNINITGGKTITVPTALTTTGGVTVTTGNASFTSNLTLSTSNFTNVPAGNTVTVGGTMSFTSGRLVNSNTGSVTVSGNVAWLTNASNTAIDNAGNGNITLNGTVSFGKFTGTGNVAANHAIVIGNAGTGTVTLAQGFTTASGTIASTAYTPTVAANNASTGKMVYGGPVTMAALTNNGTVNLTGGTVSGAVANDAATSKIELFANTTFSNAAVSNNNAAAIIKLNGNTLTLSNNTLALTNGGKIISATAATVGSGVVSISGTGATITGGELPNVTVGSGKSLTLAGGVNVYGDITSAGAVVLGGNVTLNGNYVQNVGGTLGLAASTFDIKGNFTRTSNVPGDVTYTTGVLQFSGSAAQTFTGGASLTLYDLVVAKTAATILTLAQTVQVANNFTITSGTVALGDNHIRMIGAGVFTNTGGYTSTGNGYIIFESGGAQTITGTALFSNIDVRNGSTVTATSNINFSGNLMLRSGVLAIGANTFTWKNDLVAVPSVTRTTTGTMTVTTGTIAAAAGVLYDLTYIGNGDIVAAAEWKTGAGIRNLTVATGNATTPQTVTAGGAATTIAGVLTVNEGQTLDLNTFNLTLSGANQAHVVAGRVIDNAGAGSDKLIFTGNGSSLTGSTVAAALAQVPSIDVNIAAGETFTATNIKTIVGDLTIANGTVNVTMAPAGVLTGNLTVTAGATTFSATGASTHGGNIVLTAGSLNYTRGSAAAADYTLGGSVTLTAGTFTLGSNLIVNGVTSQVAGNVVAAGNNYTAKGAFTRSGAGTWSASTGKLIIAAAGAVNFDPGTGFQVPNFEIANGAGNAVTLISSFEVTNAYTQTSGDLNLVAKDLTLSGGTFTYTAGTYAATTGAIKLTGSDVALTAASAPTFVNLTVAPTGTLTLANKTAATPLTFTVSGVLTQSGNINTGIHTVEVNGTFTRTAGTWAQTTGYLVLDTPTAFAQGTDFAVDNLEVDQSVSGTVATAFTVNKNLVLAGGTLTMDAGKLVLGDNIVIERRADAAMLSSVPTFNGVVSVKYTTAAGIATAANFRELPTTVKDFSVLTPATVTLPKNVTVTGTLTLSDVLTTVASTKNITMGAGATLVLKANGGTVLPGTDLVRSGALNIVYDGATATTTRELGAVASGAYTAATGNVEFKSATVVLANALTIGGKASFTGGTLDMNAKNVTVKGDVVQTSTAGFFANSGAAANLNFGGATNTALTLKQTWQLPANNVIKFTVAKDSSNKSITLTGGDLDFATNSTAVPNNNVLYLANGVLATGGTTNVILKQDVSAANQPVQGFDRSAVTGSNESHVFGRVKKFVDNTKTVDISVVTFPVGSSTAAPFYRPLSMFFKTAPQSSLNLTVSHVDQRAGGSNGFPLTAGSKVITNYPNFYWYATTDVPLNPSYKYDLEAQAKGYTDYISDQIQNVRFVRRDSGSVANPWILQGNDANYDNSTIATIWPVVKVIDATGGITSQGSIFTYSQGNKPPVFTSAPGNIKNNEGDTLNVTITSADPDMNQTATITAVTLPTGASFNASTGKLTWAIPFTAVTAAEGKKTFSFTFRTTDNSGAGASRDTTFVDTVYNVNRAPSFVNKLGNVTIKDSTNALSYQYTATDVDGDTYTFTLAAGAPAGVSITPAGLLTWTPTFVQSSKAGTPYTVKVYVADANGLKDSTTATVTVVRLRAKGDINGDAIVGTADATIALQAAVGTKTFTMPADTVDFWAGDVTGNGSVSALDASYILRKVAGDTVTFAPKMAKAYNGSVEFGKAVSGAKGITIPVKVSNAQNVTAVTFTVNVDAKVASFEGTKTTLPKDWVVMSSNNNGVVTVAMAGITPINSGDVATISISLKEKEARINVSGSGFVNEAEGQSLSLDNVRMMPSEFALDQNYPNPFNPTTTIKYQLTEDSKVNLTIYNLQGQVVRTLVNDNVAAGFQSVTWNGKNDRGQSVASGMYMYRIQAGSFVSVKKMLMLK
ncbi:MAG: FlgD immunoglobulin-like domain containing protein [Acidobacteriota bacterium]